MATDEPGVRLLYVALSPGGAAPGTVISALGLPEGLLEP